MSACSHITQGMYPAEAVEVEITKVNSNVLVTWRVECKKCNKLFHIQQKIVSCLLLNDNQIIGEINNE